MKVCVLLLCVSRLLWRSEAQSRTYMVTAPLALHLDAEEKVVVQLFDFTEEVRVYVYLKTSMGANHKVLSQDVLTLSSKNQHQGAARVRLLPGQLDKGVSQVILHVQSAEINQHVPVTVSRQNGFLFVQTDKPLYTPRQSVKVRVFSLNQELHPANRKVFLTFKDPDKKTVDIQELVDINNGIPSMQNPFKIPVKPKLGIWSIEASYSNEFTTKAQATFEVKEYVLPSLSILVEPEANYISHGTFQRFLIKVSAKYLHGAPVANGEVFLRFGYVSKSDAPVIIPKSVILQRLSSNGEVDVIINMEKILSKHDGPRDLRGLLGKNLYIAVLLQEDTGGVSQEAEFADVKFVQSPFSLSLVSTPPFIKPGLPYNIQVLVKDHLDQPVGRVPIRLTEGRLQRRGGGGDNMPCPDSVSSGPDGLAVFICNTPSGAEKAVLRFETSAAALPATSQASLVLEASAYQSPNRRYLYIDPPLPNHSLKVGLPASIKVYSATPAYIHIKTISFLVISRGKVVHFGTQPYVPSADHQQTLRFQVTGAMVPSVRLLVYYTPHGEGLAELVADSVWLDVKDSCVNGLQTKLTYQQRAHRPQSNLQLNLQTSQQGLVALSAVDTGLFNLRHRYRDPVSMVLRHIEQSDQGCGGGGGRDSSDVFRLAGLTFITNANARPASSGASCTAAVRVRRQLTQEDKIKKAKSFGALRPCCEQGMKYLPKAISCQQRSQQFRKAPQPCRQAFSACCEFLQRHLDQNLILARQDMGVEFDEVPSLVRSYFPESWLWEVQQASGKAQSLSRKLPDSLTTWQIRAVGVFSNGICVAEPVQVSVNLPLSLNVPLPYQLVRGEQLELKGSVYNQQLEGIMYCVTLSVGSSLCLLQSQPDPRRSGLHSTSCRWTPLSAGGVGSVTFTLMALEPGEHTLTFTLKTRGGDSDVLEKKLLVVPEGVRQDLYSGGRLDPQGLYGSRKMTVDLKNIPPPNAVPNTPVERVLTISGEILGDVISIMVDPEGLRQLVNLPAGSVEAELGGVLPLVNVYLYMEVTRSWGVLGGDIQQKSNDVKRRIKEGLVSISSFRGGDFSYSMWRKREASTWLTAAVVRTLAQVDQVFSVDHQDLSESVSWLIRRAQQQDGSFSDRSSYRPNHIMAPGTNAVEQKVYLTAFVLIALHGATSISDPILQLRFHDDSMSLAASFLSKHAPAVKSVYVRALAAFAVTLHEPHGSASSVLMTSLEGLARQKGHPAELRYWQEPGVTADWLKPDQSSGLTVETTAYVLLTTLLKGRVDYANPIVTWLTQDQHYGQGFYSVQDTVVTLEALTAYSRTVPKAVLDQVITVSYKRRGDLGRVQLSQSRPVATPIQVTKPDDLVVSTGYGTGVSKVKLRTVFYQTSSDAADQTCNFHLMISLVGADASQAPSMRSPHLVACAKYKPRPNEAFTESGLTVMKIQLPTGVQAHLDDLRQFRDLMEPLISHYELEGNTVVIQMDSVPSESFLCVGFRIRTTFQVGGASESLFSVYEPQDKGSMCTKQFSSQEQKLQRLCVAEQCQCMTAACATFRGDVDPSLTASERTAETCKPHIKYAYKVQVKSFSVEGDFMTFSAIVVEVLKNTDKAFEAVSSGTEVALIKRATCNLVDVQVNKQYLLLGSSGSEVTLGGGVRYRLPLDSEAVVEDWPSGCRTPECSRFVSQLEDFALELQLFSCPPAQ